MPRSAPPSASPRAEPRRDGATPRSFLSIADLDPTEIRDVLDDAVAFKRAHAGGADPPALPGAVAALIFQKPSLRTRVSFEVGMRQLGGHALYLSPAEIQLGQREGVADAARVLSRYVDVIVARVFLHEDVVALATHATVPVVNALSDREHPCQILADLLTLRERWGTLRGMTLAYVGDGNNVATSLALVAPLVGLRLRLAFPAGYAIPPDVLDRAGAEGAVEVCASAVDAVRDADAVYTDAWYSMGQEDEAEIRRGLFAPFQVNAALMAHATPGALVLHCLPAHRGQEITDEVIDGPGSVVYDQAENRLHAQKALLVRLLGRR